MCVIRALKSHWRWGRRLWPRPRFDSDEIGLVDKNTNPGDEPGFVFSVEQIANLLYGYAPLGIGRGQPSEGVGDSGVGRVRRGAEGVGPLLSEGGTSPFITASKSA